MPEVSICIPVYEMNGKGVEMLSQLLDSINNQSFVGFEVVVSDHSSSTDLRDLCNTFPLVRHVPYSEMRGSSSANLNNAIRHASGRLIKPMFQDDYFSSKEALACMVEELKDSGSKWSVCSCYIVTESGETVRTHTPQIVDKTSLVMGRNTMGAPSCIIYENHGDLSFDTNLIWLMDCDFYYSLFEKYGVPHLVKNLCVSVREWGGRVTDTLATQTVRKQEDIYMKEKFKRIQKDHKNG